MIGAKDQKGVPRGEEVNAFLGKGTTFEGKMTFEGLFRLDGKFNGEIFSGDSLIIGETGEVHAEITVNTLIVKGKLEGSITAKTRVEIHPPGKILGDIQTPVLVIEEGAVFDGNCRMEKAEAKRDEKISVLKTKGETEGAKGTTEMEKESGS
jgi:cytoskeletal protein CcmA (bactofilin family)